MAETNPPSPTQEEMHWGLPYLQNDLKELKQDQRELRREAQDFRKDMAQEFVKVRQEAQEFRKEMVEQFVKVRQELVQLATGLRAEARQDVRMMIMVMIAMSGVTIGVLMAFIEYRLPAG